jgi:DNA-binding FrmR family transcriptional regulator
MDAQAKDAVRRRIKSIAGHIAGIERMIDQEAYCIDVIKQVQAVQAALNKVNDLILENHLNTCVISAVRGNDAKQREKVLDEIVDVFEMAQKI